MLSCAHMFWERGGQRVSQAMKNKPITIEGWSIDAPSGLGRVKIVAISTESDLSLMEVDKPMPFVSPVALEIRSNRRLISVGFDNMRWPATNKSATILRHEGSQALTREKPWHGRSGGGLLDADTGELVGVVSGYRVGPGPYREIDDYPGIYVSHEAILKFLGGQK